MESTMPTAEELAVIEEKFKAINKALIYLKKTDFYYVRQIETGESIPSDVIQKRTEMRDFLRANGY
jgi:hypothetical protein